MTVDHVYWNHIPAPIKVSPSLDSFKVSNVTSKTLFHLAIIFSSPIATPPHLWFNFLQLWCVTKYFTLHYITSHAHTVVWECSKDDRQSQWGMAKFDPQPTLNPWTDRHQIWNTWLGRGHIPPKHFGVNLPRGFWPHMREITQNLRMFTSLFFSFLSSEPPETSPLSRFSRLIRHTTCFCKRKEVPFGVRKFNFKI